MQFQIILQSLFFLLLFIYVATEYIPAIFSQIQTRKKRKGYPPLSIIIPVKNEERVIEKILIAWFGIDYPALKEVIVCDQFSTDNTKSIVERLEKKYTGALRFCQIEAPNKLAVLLKGLKKAKYNYVVLSDADRIPNKDGVKNLISYMEDKIGAVFGMAKVDATDNFFKKITAFEYLNSMLEMIMYSNFGSAPYLYMHSCIVRKAVIQDLPPQSLIADDLYLALSIVKRGYKALFIPNVVAGEEKVVDFPDVVKKRLRTSQGTIEIAKSNFMNTAFNPSYGIFGLVLMPFRQLIIFGNMLTVIFFILILLGLAFFSLSWKFIWNSLFIFYFLLVGGQMIRYIRIKAIFKPDSKTMPFFIIFVYPFFVLAVRKFLAGYTFITALFGIKYRWSKSLSDRS